jgi:hypothetical protein
MQSSLYLGPLLTGIITCQHITLSTTATAAIQQFGSYGHCVANRRISATLSCELIKKDLTEAQNGFRGKSILNSNS